jgi:hypothetical protein
VTISGAEFSSAGDGGASIDLRAGRLTRTI